MSKLVKQFSCTEVETLIVMSLMDVTSICWRQRADMKLTALMDCAALYAPAGLPNFFRDANSQQHNRLSWRQYKPRWKVASLDAIVLAILSSCCNGFYILYIATINSEICSYKTSSLNSFSILTYRHEGKWWCKIPLFAHQTSVRARKWKIFGAVY